MAKGLKDSTRERKCLEQPCVGARDCPEDSLRDGSRAVRLAQQAVRISGGRIPIVFRTLAAAYAENQQFPQAIETAQVGAELANKQGNFALAAELQQHHLVSGKTVHCGIQVSQARARSHRSE